MLGSVNEMPKRKPFENCRALHDYIVLIIIPKVESINSDLPTDMTSGK